MSIVSKKIMMGSGAAGDPVDDQFNRVSFLSHFEGSNNGVNNAFDDGSASNHTITANGDVTQGSFGPYGTNWSVDFDGGDYFTVPQDADFNVDDGSYTMECFVNTTFSGYQNIIACWDGATSGNPGWGMFISSGNQFGMFVGTAEVGKAGAVVNDGAWHHLAGVFTNSGATITLYVDGAQISTGSVTAPSDNAASIIRIGSAGNASATSLYTGKISNLRLVKGTAVYSGSSFTVPTSALTAITNTKLLVLGRNNFSDGSASGHVLTPISDPTVTAFGPFLTDAVYDPAVNGASAHFEGGNGDYLSLSPQSDFAFGTGDFSISLWVYYHNVGNFDYLIDGRNSGQTSGTWTLSINYTNSSSGKLMLASGNSAILTSDTNLIKNQWYYISVSRSGTTSRMHFNGTQVAINSSDSTNYSTAPNTSYIGTRYSTQHSFDGIMGDVRVVKGTALSSYTPPTAPLTAITNTKLLLNMADGQAIDSAAQNNLTLYGTAKTSTAQKKFGTASLLLDGNSDYVSFADTDAKSMFNFGASKWTIEGWFYQENDAGSSSNSHSIISRWDNQNSDKGFIFRITDSSGQKLQWLHTTDGSTNVVYTDSRTISNDTWYHFALVKNDNLTLYLNGTGAVLNSSTFTIASTTIPTWIGSVHESGSPSQYFDGYIDDLRVSHMARYTSDFTAPTAAFPDKGQ